MTELKRSLSLYGLTMIAIGCTIGSGIFRTPGHVALHVHSPDYVIWLWILGGVVALAGALTFAEMGGMFPGAGGLYVYLREAYGDLVGFLYGWFILFCSTAGAIAALALVCAEHLCYLYGSAGDSVWEIPLAAGIIVVLTVVNLFGVGIGEWIANLFGGAKLVGLVMIIGAGMFFANPQVDAANAASVFVQTPPENLMSALALGFIGVLWSYGGWQHASYMAGETKDPQRTVPRAMILGAVVITLVYVLANVAYMRLLPLEQIAHSKTVAADAMNHVTTMGGTLMALLIALSTFGSIGIYSVTSPRMYYAMAKDGVFFAKLAEIHPKWRTPVWAMLIQSAWALFLLFFWGTFNDLIEYVTFLDWIGLMLVGTTIFVFRKKRPDAERSYRTTFYPLTPIVFVAICAWFVAFNIVGSWQKALAGLVVVLAGIAAYYAFFRKKT
ncbi:MAG TPA: amino acid permease [Saprospiraceae bacterium]|nr:amino acid permease [Saprospiraceae bacterium]